MYVLCEVYYWKLLFEIIVEIYLAMLGELLPRIRMCTQNKMFRLHNCLKKDN